MLENINTKHSSENQIDDFISNSHSPFLFKQLFDTEPEIENEEEVKLGIHYSINFRDIYKEGHKLGEVFYFYKFFKECVQLL